MMNTKQTPETDAATSVETNAESSVEASPEAVVGANVETVEANAESGVEANVETVEANAESGVEANVETVEANAESGVEANVETIEANAGSGVEANVETIEANAGSGVEADVETIEANAGNGTEANLVSGTPNVTDVVSPEHAQHLRLLEALIFAGTQALDEKELADRLPNDADVKRLLADLAELYAARGVNLVQVAGGFAFRTASDLAEKLKIERPVTRKLSRAGTETLAIIAFHQPVTRAEIEQVRGVGLSKGTLDLLFEQNWIKPMGRRRAPGKPVTWGTTDFFLEHFGLPSLDDLPGQEELRAAGLLDPRAQPPIFRPEEPDLPLEPTEDEADEPLAVDGTGH